MNIIMKDLIKLMDPKYIEVWGKFLPRGGLSITESREPGGNRSHGTACGIMTCIRKKLIIDETYMGLSH